MRVHRGTYESDGRPTRWIETTIRWDFTLEELIDGLCSHYIRNRTEDDEQLPAKLMAREIVRVAREEYKEHGTANVCTWGESGSGYDSNEARAWARCLILIALPDLETPQQ